MQMYFLFASKNAAQQPLIKKLLPMMYEHDSRTKEALCLLTFLVANFTIICLCCPSLFKHTLWDTDMSCGSTDGSTFMSSQTFSTATSVSSWLGFSRMPATGRLFLQLSKSSSIVCWSSIVSLRETISRSRFVAWEGEFGGGLLPKLHPWTVLCHW